MWLGWAQAGTPVCLQSVKWGSAHVVWPSRHAPIQGWYKLVESTRLEGLFPNNGCSGPYTIDSRSAVQLLEKKA